MIYISPAQVRQTGYFMLGAALGFGAGFLTSWFWLAGAI